MGDAAVGAGVGSDGSSGWVCFWVGRGAGSDASTREPWCLWYLEAGSGDSGSCSHCRLRGSFIGFDGSTSRRMMKEKGAGAGGSHINGGRWCSLREGKEDGIATQN